MNARTAADISALAGDLPVIPVLVIERASDAYPLAQALVAGGLNMLEVTLRTAEALRAVTEIATRVPEAIVGVGSVTDPSQLTVAAQAGARFAVSPGATAALLTAAAAAPLPWMPGAQTVSEVLTLRSAGYRLIKFFPAEAGGGVDFLRCIAGPVPDVSFCPTGGIGAASAAGYLALPNVRCIGGTWVAPQELIASGNWQRISALAHAARALRKS